MSYLSCVEIEPRIAADSAVVWLHGLGADGNDFVPVARELCLPETAATRFVFPHAPSLPVTINGGYVMPAWYDIFEANLDRRVDQAQLSRSAEAVTQLIHRELARGISGERIILAGFSQGGAVAYHAALTCSQPLGGLLVLSSYFPACESIQLNPVNKHLPILIQHGTYDPIVPELLGQRAYQQLLNIGYKPAYEVYSTEHTVCGPQIAAISQWMKPLLETKVSPQ